MEMKERIQQKANDLFCRYGVKSVTMDEIAAQLGVSKKTIYQFFSDKDELVEAVVTRVIRDSEKTCNFNRDNSRDAVHELFQVMDFIQDLFKDMNPSMIHDLEKFHVRSYRIFLDYKNKYLYHMIKDNIHRGMREELFRNELNVEIIAKFRLEGMMLAFNPDLYPPSKFNLVETHQTIIEHFLFGVASLKGYKLILKYQQERLKSLDK